MALTIKSFKELWTKELMPEFKSEILNDLKREIRNEIQNVVQRFEAQINEVKNQIQGVETSQSFISDKYENVIEVTQSLKKEMKTVQSHYKESKERLECLEQEASYNMAVLNEVQQYLRRDCLEIAGIPIVPLDDPNSLVSEVCSAMDIELQNDDISIAHRLPSTTKVKDRIIVKFVKRSKRDEIYKHRSKLKEVNL